MYFRDADNFEGLPDLSEDEDDDSDDQSDDEDICLSPHGQVWEVWTARKSRQ